MDSTGVANVAGNPVEGESFFDRKREIELLWSRLETDNVLLLAPRRVGKTSLMYRLRDTAGERRCLAVYVSVADARSELDFVRKLYDNVGRDQRLKRALRRVTKGPLGRCFKRTRKLGLFGLTLELDDAGHEQWAALGDGLAREISRDLEPPRDRLLLLLDELPVFILELLRLDPSGARARTFLNWFRQLRLEPAVNPRVRWLIAGSIGLDTVARRLRLSDTINDLAIFNELGAFSAGASDAFLAALAGAYGLPLAEDVRGHIVRRVGWPIPFHLQLVFAELRTACGDGQGPATVAAVDEVFERLLSPGKRALFDYWAQRLYEELGTLEAGFALALLDASAVDPAGVSLATLQAVLGRQVSDAGVRDERLHYLLDVLESDGYLVRGDGRWRFRSALLAEFWRRRLVP